MATRDYQAPTFNVGDNREFRQAPVVASDTRAQVGLTTGDSNWRTQLLTKLGGDAENALLKLADMHLSNQYLEGAAQAGIIESEEELQADPFTRDWKVAGYRDTMGKLALAENEAKFGADLVKLRQEGPEKLKQYLADRRAKVMPALGSMSREARANAAGQMLMQDSAATKQWTSEHIAFITEEKTAAVMTQVNTSMNSLVNLQLKAATGAITPETFKQQLRSSAGTLVGSIWEDSTLPQAVKTELTFNMVNQALAKDLPDLYEYLSSTSMPNGKGGESTLIARLPGEQQVKLANQYRESMQRTEDVRSMYRNEQLAHMRAEMKNGTYTKTYDEHKDFLNSLLINKTINGEKHQQYLMDYVENSYKTEKASLGASAAINGDVQTLSSLGLSNAEGVTAVETMLTKNKADPTTRLNTWLNMGEKGNSDGYQKAGEMLGTAIRQMSTSPDGNVLSQHAEVFKQVNARLANLEGTGRSVAQVKLLSGLSEQDRDFAQTVFSGVDLGDSLDNAIATARKNMELSAKLTPATRAAMATTKATDITTAINELEPLGRVEEFTRGIARMFGSQDAANTLKLAPSSYMNDKDGWFSDSPTVQFYLRNTKEEITLAAQKRLKHNPFAEAGDILKAAEADVVARTIETDFGPLVMPDGSNITSLFGVATANKSAIGPALNVMLKPTNPDNSVQLKFTEGRLLATEVTPDGRPGREMFINPKDVNTEIRRATENRRERANWIFGSGKTVNSDATFGVFGNQSDALSKFTGIPNSKEAGTTPPTVDARGMSASGKITKGGKTATSGNAAVNYNGLSTSGAPAEWVYDFRDNLVKHEGIRSKAYKDLSGKLDDKGQPIMTVGVGVSSHNPNFPKLNADGTASSEEITRSFALASNEAASAGVRIAKQLGVYSKAGFSLMSELAYQSGVNFMNLDSYKAVGAAIQRKDAEAAKAAFMQTPAWKQSRDRKNASATTARQLSYIKLIEDSMKGL